MGSERLDLLRLKHIVYGRDFNGLDNIWNNCRWNRWVFCIGYDPWMEGGNPMIIELIVIGFCMFCCGLYVGHNLGKTARKIVLPEWVQMVRDSLGF